MADVHVDGALADDDVAATRFLQRKTIVRKFMTELWQPRRNLVAALALWRECGWACWGTRSSRP
jgi:hypothetical protein